MCIYPENPEELNNLLEYLHQLGYEWQSGASLLTYHLSFNGRMFEYNEIIYIRLIVSKPLSYCMIGRVNNYQNHLESLSDMWPDFGPLVSYRDYLNSLTPY